MKSSCVVQQKRSRDRRAFQRRFPNAVARDMRLSEPALVILAYRSTFVGVYALSVTALIRGQIVHGRGLGRDVIERAIHELVAASYLERNQPVRQPGGPFRRVEEEIRLPSSGASGNAARVVRKSWFDGSLTLKELAALLFLRAGLPNRAEVFPREIAERFGWSIPTVNVVINALVQRKLVIQTRRRRPDGTFTATTYRVVSRVPALLPPAQSTATKPGPGKPGNGKSGNLQKDIPPHVLEPAARENPLQTGGPGTHVHRDKRDGRSPSSSLEEIESEAFGFELLGWIDDYEKECHTSLQDLFDPDLFDELVETVSDSWLHAALSDATRKRISPKIFSPAGLYAVRWLAACMHDTDDPLDTLLRRISTRIGKRPGAWLNSLALIGKGVVHSASSWEGKAHYVEIG